MIFFKYHVSYFISQGDEIKFHATEIESFYIIKIPQKEKEIIKPEGNTLSFKHSKKVSLDMPSQTVDTPQQIDLQVNITGPQLSFSM